MARSAFLSLFLSTLTPLTKRGLSGPGAEVRRLRTVGEVGGDGEELLEDGGEGGGEGRARRSELGGEGFREKRSERVVRICGRGEAGPYTLRC